MSEFMKANITNATKGLGVGLVVLAAVFILSNIAPVDTVHAANNCWKDSADPNIGKCDKSNLECRRNYCRNEAFLWAMGFYDRELKDETKEETKGETPDDKNNDNKDCRVLITSSSSSSYPAFYEREECSYSSSSSSSP